jgi:hypothetical protein
MLPQSQALRVAAADKPGSARNGRQQRAAAQPVRGEKKPAPQNAERGVTRTFVLSKEGNRLVDNVEQNRLQIFFKAKRL